ncbi:MAG TPA: hypothetical protein PK079_14955 [Leptospiraceae bacterium]|nr:hypothetical protein [Leptospiraceae bacterium]HMW07813.1 hypothetical protein [Leptospiraceae bacterium]HMX35514.1 hypothetical protein [Leptospiraceae bacterium]HMY33501.1 hypothetical protein [Leptospiraceae bacterium]HMZ65631.1 hypothetical protein [Leptospiraceae bacterium]
MTIIPRKFDSEIKITETGRWLFRGQEITQENVLSFFKKNICEDDKGIYITNSYADKVEHGYLEANCIFLKIENAIETSEGIFLQAEDESITPLKDFDFYSDKEEKLFCMRKKDQFIKFKLNRKSHDFISNLLEEENGRYFLKTKEYEIPVTEFSGKIEVRVPAF